MGRKRKNQPVEAPAEVIEVAEAAPGIPVDVAESIAVDESPIVGTETPVPDVVVEVVTEPVVEPPSAEPTAVAETQVADAGQSLYRDRSAPPREKIITEGAANFATVTAAARGESNTSET